ncbi:putative phosphoribosyl transferase [Hartmannibacter diazotrophicus]|uniref:Putative phosphoribosyl transferase n=1 Tax=Hartmannibacter diazotrophicus TaxID=1482074 RepID=A0A2C9D7W8_9HYPH|nr:phosphoribosyltransferase [Hartmannibacter diazotrophicus]SON56343.1 putative phosphoribosyl transferase [Hartmannibacter diazotrophicus]
MPFDNRREAGRKLAEALASYRAKEPVILALPRGGVPVAAEVADALGAPLDLVIARKVGLPDHPELAMGAVSDGAEPVIIRNEDVIRASRIGKLQFDAACRTEIEEIERRRQRYAGPRDRPDLKGRVVIVVDDGIATGATAKAALGAVRQQHPRELVLAVPVAPADTIGDLRRETDRLVCLETPELFGAIGFFYVDFRPARDEEVISILQDVRTRREGTP